MNEANNSKKTIFPQTLKRKLSSGDNKIKSKRQKLDEKIFKIEELPGELLLLVLSFISPSKLWKMFGCSQTMYTLASSQFQENYVKCLGNFLSSLNDALLPNTIQEDNKWCKLYVNSITSDEIKEEQLLSSYHHYVVTETNNVYVNHRVDDKSKYPPVIYKWKKIHETHSQKNLSMSFKFQYCDRIILSTTKKSDINILHSNENTSNNMIFTHGLDILQFGRELPDIK